MKKLLLVGIAMLPIAFASAAQAVDGRPISLACQGTIADNLAGKESEPVSMGIFVDFTNRTVQGGFSFASHSLFGPDSPIPITEWNDTTVSFNGKGRAAWSTEYVEESIWGNIDRVTGDVEAHITSGIVTNHYTLKCRPVKRMF